MFKDVSMEHPLAGRARNEGDVNALLGQQQYRVSAESRQFTQVGRQHFKGVAVNVDRVRMRRQILKFEDIAFAAFEFGERRPKVFVIVAGPRLFINCPERSLG